MKRKNSSTSTGTNHKRSKSAATQAQIKALQRDVEQKWYDTTFSDATVITTANDNATLSTFFTPDRGVTQTNRIGRKVFVHSVQWKLIVMYKISDPSTTAGSSAIRLVLVYDRQSNGVSPAVTDVFNTDAIESFTNKDNSKRFKIIADRLLEGISVSGPQNVAEEGIRLFKKPLETYFDGTGGGISDVTTGSYHWFVWCGPYVLTQAPYTRLSLRVRYSDP